MNACSHLRLAPGLAAALCLPLIAHAFDSGSTGADGALNPTVNLTIPLPPSGVLNYTEVNIPAGVTVQFRRNATNTPVVMLVSGNAVINGTLSVSGSNAQVTGTAGDGNQGDDGLPGIGGPGGFDGGRGGPGGISSKPCANEAEANKFRAGAGLGPGGGGGGRPVFYTYYGSCYREGGAGGGFSSASQGSSLSTLSSNAWQGTATAGPAYGSELLLPLIGGSGGGGGAGGAIYGGSGGGGGGGALLLAASGTVTLGSAGKITANGGWGGQVDGPADAIGGSGGGGAGGAIRVVASTIAGNGMIEAAGGETTDPPGSDTQQGTRGAPGRIRLEADAITYNRATNPQFTKGAPGTLFIAGLPTLKIVSVAGLPAPEQPSGNADITLPSAIPNPVTVVFHTTQVPLGNTVLLTVAPAHGPVIRVQSPALSGVTESATASVEVNLPPGPSVLQATTTYTMLAAAGDAMSSLAGNERVEQVELSASPGQPAVATLITVSGRRFPVAPAALAALAAGG